MMFDLAKPRNRHSALATLFSLLSNAGSQRITLSHRESHSITESHIFSQIPLYCSDLAYCYLRRSTKRME